MVVASYAVLYSSHKKECTVSSEEVIKKAKEEREAALCLEREAAEKAYKEKQEAQRKKESEPTFRLRRSRRNRLASRRINLSESKIPKHGRRSKSGLRRRRPRPRLKDSITGRSTTRFGTKTPAARATVPGKVGLRIALSAKALVNQNFVGTDSNERYLVFFFLAERVCFDTFVSFVGFYAMKRT